MQPAGVGDDKDFSLAGRSLCLQTLDKLVGINLLDGNLDAHPFCEQILQFLVGLVVPVAVDSQFDTCFRRAGAAGQ